MPFLVAGDPNIEEFKKLVEKIEPYSDILEIGQMLDLVNLDEPSILTLITGLEQYDPYASSSDVNKKIRILNTFAGRAWERHIPQLKKGRIGWAVQQEFGF